MSCPGHPVLEAGHLPVLSIPYHTIIFDSCISTSILHPSRIQDLSMGRRDRKETGNNPDLFGNTKKSRKRQKGSVSPPGVTTEVTQRISRTLGFVNPQPQPPPDPDNDVWVDILEDPNLDINNYLPAADSSGDQYARYQRQLHRAEARARRARRWLAQEKKIIAMYLHLQNCTLNWTTQHSYLSETINCNCSPEKCRKRSVDLIDVLSRTRHQLLTFCDCVPDVIRLLQLGYVAGSPHHPRTGFSIRLIQFHHHLWNNTTISTTGFIDALMSFLDERCTSKMRPQQQLKKSRQKNIKNINRSLRRPFTQAIDIYRRVLEGQQILFEEGLQLTPHNLSANQCSRCFGPAEGEQKASPDEPAFIIAMDGNFQQRHQSHASKDTPEEEQYPPCFIRPSQLQPQVTACKATESAATDIKTPCSDSHTAANDVRNSQSWDRCDDTGLFACACCHDVALYFVNIYKSGEKLYYPVSILKRLRSLYPDKHIAVLYDIGCHLDAHIAKRQLFPPDNLKMTFGTSVFHAYVHEWACQIRFNPRFNKYWGLSDGEGLERLWSFLSALVSVLRISTRLHRLQAIYWRDHFYKTKLTEASGQWLRNRIQNAMKVLREAQTFLISLFATPNPAQPGQTYSEGFLREQWELEREAYATKKVAIQKQQLELGRLLCLQDEQEAILSRVANTPEQAIFRLQEIERLREAITKQAEVVGTGNTSQNSKEQEDFLKLWYSKHEVALKYIAMTEEKRPMQQSRSDGHNSNLGKAQYQAKYPNQQLPEPIDYSELLLIKADHPFWNDSLFTKLQDPWATDPKTRDGMRQLAYLDQANEELRRLGWEVCRMMRWATTSHDRIRNCLNALLSPPVSEHNPATPFISHSILSNLPPQARSTAAAVIVKNQYIKLTNLQLLWNEEVLEVFSQTRFQPGDEGLKEKWLSQIDHITTLWKDSKLSMIPGDVDTPPLEEDLWEDISNHQSDDDMDSSDDDDEGAKLVHGLDLEEIKASVDAETLE
ncbi:hypothetical protein DFH28DRAFT_1223442 [Melampsora americana]|nr:hypothetical protein DFH28DRAFT_1223442 [Melampsora americana]